MSFKNRITYLDYYWENMKVDMSKVLLSEKKETKKAKNLSLRIFSTDKDVKKLFIEQYAEYTR